MKESNFTKEQLDYIMNNYPHMQTWEIADKLHSTVKEISDIANKKMHISKDSDFIVIRKNGKINIQQAQYICEHYATMHTKDIAKETGLTCDDISNFARRRHLRKDTKVLTNSYSVDFIKKLKEDYPFYSNEELSRKYNIDVNKISYLSIQYHFPNKDKKIKQLNRSCKLTKEQKEYIEKYYHNTKTSQLIKNMNVPYAYIRSYVNNHKLKKDEEVNKGYDYYIKRRKDNSYQVSKYLGSDIEPKVSNVYKSIYGKYELNNCYFSKIDNEWKAYWLGFLYADGCVRLTRNNKSNKQINSLILSLCRKDKEHIQKFLNSLQATYVISDYTVNCHGKQYESSKVTITNKQIVLDLISLGCVPNKSLILQFPTENQVPTNLIRHFIRGYFDGDGCIHIDVNKKNASFSILGTKDFLTKLKKHLMENIPNLTQSGHKIKKDSSTSKAYSFSFSKLEDLSLLYNYLYNGCNIYLDRKLQKFDSLFCLD